MIGEPVSKKKYKIAGMNHSKKRSKGNVYNIQKCAKSILKLIKIGTVNICSM